MLDAPQSDLHALENRITGVVELATQHGLGDGKPGSLVGRKRNR